jgi:alkanesulfonate monooxygenase SsuD/methylene tetrahydromethanopterin reductase-like flavin-dependent oxidoreductase (luciferase family)
MSTRFGLLIADAPPGMAGAQWFSDCLAMTAAAREAGFHSIVVGQHFVAGSALYLQPVPLLARLAAETTSEMRLVTGILLLPLLPPVEVAEQLATLDIISEGRLIVGVGAGYREDEFRAFGVGFADRAARLVQSLSIVRELWSGERVSIAGVEGEAVEVTCGVVPLQPGGPPIWMAGNADGAIRRAARHADAWYGYARSDLDLIERQVSLYRAELTAHGRPMPAELPMRREVFIAATSERAWSLAESLMAPRLALNDQWGVGRDLPAESRSGGSFRDYARGRFIIGDPQACRDEIARYREHLGDVHIVTRIRWPGMSLEETRDALALFGEVIRSFEEIGAH